VLGPVVGEPMYSIEGGRLWVLWVLWVFPNLSRASFFGVHLSSDVLPGNLARDTHNTRNTHIWLDVHAGSNFQRGRLASLRSTVSLWPLAIVP
jgi:hypothetical protein